MEKASIIDIQGVQWAIKDQEATDNINAIKEQLTPKKNPRISIEMNVGYSANTALILNIVQFGRIHIGNIFIDNISGNNIGTINEAKFGKVSFKPFDLIHALCFDYETGKIARFGIQPNGDVSFLESLGIPNGNNKIRGQIVWIE